MQYTVRIKGNGTPEQFREIHDTVRRTSPNYFNVARRSGSTPSWSSKRELARAQPPDVRPHAEVVMNAATWVLLGFAAWTILTLLVGVGAVRWSLILTGRQRLNEFPADVPHGSPRYRRAMRAHANCVENLPVYGAVAVTATLSGVGGTALHALPPIFLARARPADAHPRRLRGDQPSPSRFRFAFFFIQLVCMAWMGAVVAWP